MAFPPLFRHAIVSLCLFAGPLWAVSPFEADRNALLSGVKEIGISGSPGPVCVFGPQSFSVINGKTGKTLAAPLVAAAHWEKGRVVAFGHGGYLGLTSVADTGTLLTNAVRWCAGDGAPKPKILVVRLPELAALLKTQGFEVEATDAKDWSKRLDHFRAVCVDAHRLAAESDVPALAKFVKAGGGLLTAGLGWGWQQLNPGKVLLTDFPGNQLLGAAGLAWGEGTIEKTTPAGFVPVDAPLTNASVALAALLNQEAGKEEKLSAPELAQAAWTLSFAVRSVPPQDTTFLPKLSALQSIAPEYPRPDKPLKAERGLARLLVTQNLTRLKQARPDQLKAHPAAELFPGAVPANAPRLENQAVTVNTAVPAWHSTGLYAAPGAQIRVELPANAVGKGLTARIGCHTDLLYDKDAWSRMPEISRKEKLDAAATIAANPFGGLIYIEVPESARMLGQLEVKISGAIAAPYFVLGKTTTADWLSKWRAAPAPWAELECKGVIITVPSSNIRTLENPEELMKLWQKVVDAEDDLAGTASERVRPERIVADVEISAGYMHSGYPIMTHLDSAAQAASFEKLQAGSWGHFHELGHNHQSGDWTFDGTTEVTCNIFSLFVSETVCGLPPGRGHDAMEPAKIAERLKKYLGTTASFERWKSDPFLALTLYNQLRVAFGWQTFKSVFAEYRALPKTERPANDEQKRDQWMVRMSKAAGRNLGPFFEVWGVPTSEAARASIKELPAWMPSDWPKP